MLLAIDVGNSNTVLGLYRAQPGAAEDGPQRFGSELLAQWRVTTPDARTTDEFGVLLRSLFDQSSLVIADVTGIVISSVVPPIDSTLRRVCEKFFKVRPLFIEPGVKSGLPVLTDNPAEVGADRIVNCVAGYDRFHGAVHRCGHGHGDDL